MAAAQNAVVTRLGGQTGNRKSRRLPLTKANHELIRWNQLDGASCARRMVALGSMTGVVLATTGDPLDCNEFLPSVVPHSRP